MRAVERESRCECDRRADLWLRDAEERGKRHDGQSRSDLCTDGRPAVFRLGLLYSGEFVLYVVSSVAGSAA